MTTSLDQFAQEKLDALERRALRRRLAATERRAEAETARFDATGTPRSLISFCCNDYLNLSQHPEVKAAAAEAAVRHGAGAGASRLVTGNHPLYDALEARLAALKGTEAAVVFGSGYLANLGIIPSLVGPDDLIAVDALSHACLHAGSVLARSTVRVYRHNDVDALDSILAAERDSFRHALIVTDGVFSMDGDLAPLERLTEVATRHDAWLMTDDAHGIGVLGDGRGSTFAAAQRASGPVHVPLQMGTLSKAVGSYGGYLCASQPVVDLIKTRARTLIYTTALPPASLAASLKALEIIERDRDLCARPLDHARLFCRLTDLPEPETPIVPLIVGEPEAALQAAAQLDADGFLVTPIRPPTVPEGTARLRFTFTAEHREDDIRRLAASVQRALRPKAVA